MVENRICFRVAGEFVSQISFNSAEKVPYEILAQALNKEKVAKLLFLDAIGYTADDIEIITPEQYDREC